MWHVRMDTRGWGDRGMDRGSPQLRKVSPGGPGSKEIKKYVGKGHGEGKYEQTDGRLEGFMNFRVKFVKNH